MPRCPSWLKGDGKKFYAKVSEQLAASRVLTHLDASSFAMLAHAWGEWQSLRRQCDEADPVVTAGSGALYQNPRFGLRNKAAERVRRLMAEFGLSPASRASLHVTVEDGPDELEEFAKSKARFTKRA